MDVIKHSDLIESGDPFAMATEGAESLLAILKQLEQRKRIEIEINIKRTGDAAANTAEGQAEIKKMAAEITKLTADYAKLKGELDKTTAAMNNLKTASSEYGRISRTISIEDKKSNDERLNSIAKKFRELMGTGLNIPLMLKDSDVLRVQSFLSGIERADNKIAVAQERVNKAKERESRAVQAASSPTAKASDTMALDRAIEARKRAEKSLEDAQIARVNRVRALEIFTLSKQEQLETQFEASRNKTYNAKLALKQKGANEEITIEQRKQAEIDKINQKAMAASAKRVKKDTNVQKDIEYIKLLQKENAAHDGTVDKLNATLKRVQFEYKKLETIGSATYKALKKQAEQLEAELQKANGGSSRKFTGERGEMLSSAKRVMSDFKKTDDYKYLQLVRRENEALGGSVAQLRARYNRVTFEMDKFHTIGSAAYNKLQKEALNLNNEIKKSEQAHGAWGRSVGNYATAIYNKYLAISAALSGVVYTMKRWIMLNAELSDSMAAVRRTTGMSQDEVNNLNESIRNLNTRTAQRSLLDLAHVAGKLGIAKDEILGFVRAADMIGVALGKDLGNNEEAINQLGRIVQIFKLSGTFGMEQSLIKVGSAIKDLGNSSVAEETNILDFTKRLGGIAPVAGISIDKIMALGATMDILGQTMEVSSTAISQIFIGMAQKTDKFAEIAGMSLKDFTDLMRKDFNEAFIAVAQGFQKNKQGIEEVAKYFDGLGLDGRRLIGVMTVLSENTKLYREQIAISTKGLTEAKTITEQFIIQNETLAGSIDKATKAFQNFIANSNVLMGMVGLMKEFEKIFNGMAIRFGSEEGKLQEKLINKKVLLQFTDPQDESRIKKLSAQISEIEKKLGIDKEWQNKYNAIIVSFQRADATIQANIIKNHQMVVDNYMVMWDKAIKEKDLKESQRIERELKRELKLLESLRKIKKPTANLKTLSGLNNSTLGTGVDAKEQKNIDEAYYQFLLALGRKTVDEIVEHEKKKLIELGVWKRANASEQAAWIKQATMDANLGEANRLTTDVQTMFEPRIAEANANNDPAEAYNQERAMITAQMKIFEWSHLEMTKEYKEFKDKLNKLDIEYAQKQQAYYDAILKSEEDFIALREQNDNEAAQNAIKAKENEINRIKDLVRAGQMSEVEGNAVIDELINQRTKLINDDIDRRIAQVQRKIDKLKAQRDTLVAMGILSKPAANAVYNPQIKSQENEQDTIRNSEGGKGTDTGYANERPAWDPQVFDQSTQETLQGIAAYTQAFANGMSSIFSSLTQQYQQEMDAQLAATEERYQKEYNALDAAVAGKTMSEKVAAQKKTELEKKQKAEQLKIEKEYRRKQQEMAYIQAVINIAVGVTQAIAQGGVLGIVTGAIVALAGAVELSTISSQKFAKGGYGEVGKSGTTLSGKRHSEGGVQIPGVGEAEEGEYFAIINRKSTQKYKKELPKLIKSINNNSLHEYMVQYPTAQNITKDIHTAQLFDRRGIAPNVTVNVENKFGKEMLGEMRKPQTRVYDEGNFTVYETGNYRHKISKQ